MSSPPRKKTVTIDPQVESAIAIDPADDEPYIATESNGSEEHFYEESPNRKDKTTSFDYSVDAQDENRESAIKRKKKDKKFLDRTQWS